MKKLTIMALLTVLLAVCSSCQKKSDQPEPPKAPQTKIETPKVEAPKVEVPKVEAPKVEVPKVPADVSALVDENIPLNDLKTKIGTLDVNALKATAMKYREQIVAKQGKLKDVTEALAKIPLTEKAGAEAQKLTAEVTTLTGSIKALTERFDVCCTAVKEKGGDVKDLILN